MKINRLPFIMLLVAGVSAAFLGWFFDVLVDQASMRSSYQLWVENQTFAAAVIALLAAMVAARPVYLQVSAQSVTSSLDLLRRLESESQAGTEVRNRMFELRRAALALTGELNSYAADPNTKELVEAVAGLRSFSPRELRSFAERPTINSADRGKLLALSAVLSIAHKVAAGLLASEQDGVISKAAVAAEHDFLVLKLGGLFSLASEIAEDLEIQEEEMRERARSLRLAAETSMM